MIPMLSTQTVTVASNETQSTLVTIENGNIVGMIVPTSLTSAVYFRGGATTASADQHRVQNAAGSGDWEVASNAGAAARAIAMTEVAGPFPFGRVELGAADANKAHMFTIIGKYR